jgi:subtilisin family serine protease
VVAAYKSVGAVAYAPSAGAVGVAQPALAAGDVAVFWAFVTNSQAALSVPGYTLISIHNDGGGGSIQGFWRYASSAIGATSVSVNFPGLAIAKIAVASGSTNAAPTMVPTNRPYAAYHETTPFTVAAPRLGIGFGFIFGARTQGALSSQGTLSATHTSRSYETPLTDFRLQTFSSDIASASNGAVRGAFSGGSADTTSTFFIFAEPSAPAPSGLALTPGVRQVGMSFTPTTGATQNTRRWRRTNLTKPSAVTQASAPAHLRRISQEALPMPSGYTYDFNGAGVRFYVLDTGIRATHEEFTGRIRTGSSVANPWNQDTAENPPFPKGHGTGVASMGAGTQFGAAKGATVVSINAGPEAGPPIENYQAAVEFIRQDLELGKSAVINISNGLPGTDVQREAFIQSLLDLGVAIFVAVIPDPAVEIPDGVGAGRFMLIGSSTQADVKASYSAFGAGISLYSPISSTTAAGSQSDTDTRTADGTSEATPLAAGVALKILQGNPRLSPARLYEVMLSQSFKNKITGAGASENRLLNGNANTDQWTEAPVSSSYVMDGLDDSATYEVQVASLVDGTWTPWSTSQTATTNSVSQSSGTVAGSFGGLQASVQGVRTGPAFSGSVSGSLGAVSATVEGNRAVPVFSGSAAAGLSAPTASAAGTRTIPVFSGSAVVALPTLSGSGSGEVDAPSSNSTIQAALPSLSASAAGTRTIPDRSGQVSASLPKLSSSSSGEYRPSRTGVAAAAIPALSGGLTGGVTQPGTGGSIAVSLPKLEVAIRDAGTVEPARAYLGDIPVSLRLGDLLV